MNKWKRLTISLVLILVIVGSSLGYLLAQTSGTLTSTKMTLATAQSQVVYLDNSLSLTKNVLALTQVDLSTTKQALSASQDELTTTKDNLVQTQSQLKSTQSNLAQTQTSLAAIQGELSTVKVQLAGITNGYGFVLNDPTYAMMKSFLASDLTNTHPFDVNNYNCSNFSADTIANAAKQHIRCALVYILFHNSAHFIVAFNTLDKGLVYIEPQADAEVNLIVGRHYWQSIITSLVFIPSYDDTVVSFTIIW
jgi:hypothetical protein